MKKIHLVMPLAGGGTRFLNDNYEMPKPLIELQGKPFFYWAVQSLIKYVEIENIIFVVLQEHVDKFDINKKIQDFYPDAIIRVIPEVLNGAVLTCLEGIKEINDDAPILFNDCDHAFVSNSFYEFIKKGHVNNVEGALLTFKSDNPGYSYVKFNNKYEVIGTVEKVVASTEAICGAYYFKNKKIFKEGVVRYLDHCRYKEYFTSGVYNELVDMGNRIITFAIDEHISFGTPEEYEIAKNDERLNELI